VGAILANNFESTKQPCDSDIIDKLTELTTQEYLFEYGC
jgi:hypothetical protein